MVDDAQWIDIESLQTPAFIGRRLPAEGIALLFGIRTYLDIPSDLAGIPSLEISGLPEEAASELLNIAAGQPVSFKEAERITADTNGCPLALLELGAMLAEPELNRIVSLDEPVTVSRRLEDHFNSQYRVAVG